MKKKVIDVQKVAYTLIIATMLTYLFIVGKAMLYPFLFGLLLAFMLKPICKLYERLVISRVIAILLTFLTVALPLLGLLVMFGFQLFEALNDFPLITERIIEGINEGFKWVDERYKLPSKNGVTWLNENFANALDDPILYLGDALTSSTQVLTDLLFIGLYTFFLLLYRNSLSYFFLIQFSRRQRKKAEGFLRQTQYITQQYLFGLGIVMVILGLLNSAGLILIEINYPFFWGFLAAFLAIIPYIGTIIGGSLPFLYALATTDTLWQPLAVVLLFGTVQAIEGNLITPKVVGGSVKMNSLAAILALILGGYVWGVPGLILALPVAAIFKVAFEHIDFLKPLALLMSDDLYKEKHRFLEDFNHSRYRLLAYFQKDA